MKRKPLPQINNCDDCGACCTEQAGLPVSWYVGLYPHGDASTSLPPELRAELEQFLAGWRANGFLPDGSPCVWYDPAKRQCRHYEHRPALCRDEVKVGDESCRWWRRSKGIDPMPRYRMLNGRMRLVEG